MRAKIFIVIILTTLVLLPSCSRNSGSKGTLKIYSNEVIASLDPAAITDRYSGIVAKSIYEGLYGYHYLKHTITPVLAEDLPEDLGNLKYRIRLRRDIKFADDPCFKVTSGKGRGVIAQDVIYSIKRLLSSTTNTAAVIILTDIVDGANEFRNKTTKDIKGLTAPDENTLVIQLKKYSSFFPDVFTLLNTFIVPKEAVELYGDSFATHPVGTGAFYLSENIAPAQYILKKNNNYIGTYPTDGDIGDSKNGLLNDKGATIPFVNEVIVKVLNEETARWEAFKKGDIDIVKVDKDSYFDAFTVNDELNENFKNQGVNVNKVSELDLKYIGFNMSDPLVGKNKYLRQAMSLTYDGYKHAALFDNNQATVANWIIPPGLFGFDFKYKNPYRQMDLEKAKSLLRKAGYPDGKGLPALTMYCTNSTAVKQICESFAKAMKEINITVNPEFFDHATFLKKMNAKTGYHLARLQWRADLPFAEDFLRILYGKAASPGPNRSLFNNAAYNSLYEKTLILSDGPEKLKIINKMRDLAVEECPIIPIVVPYRLVLTHQYVKNYKGWALDDYDLKYLRLEK